MASAEYHSHIDRLAAVYGDGLDCAMESAVAIIITSPNMLRITTAAKPVQFAKTVFTIKLPALRVEEAGEQKVGSTPLTR